MKVSDLFIKVNPPKVLFDATINETIIEISHKRLGATAVIDANGKLLGIVTDGDLRRMLEKYSDFSQLRAIDIMTKNPKTIPETDLAIKAFNMMEDNKITQLVVLKNDIYQGIIHMHDILREGIV
jgi:arabinose-5-phosphate isomerase